jgi:hypothetical protein
MKVRICIASSGPCTRRGRPYPPDKQEAATNTVLQQAELLSDFWTEGAKA